jgi:hypothetical protein
MIEPDVEQLRRNPLSSTDIGVEHAKEITAYSSGQDTY